MNAKEFNTSLQNINTGQFTNGWLANYDYSFIEL